MPAYDASLFSPPAPLARVVLRSSDGDTVANVPMLMDSGADVTLVPRASLERIELPAGEDESYEVMAFDGSRSLAQGVQLELIFLKRIFKGRFLISGQDTEILGRDVLNHISLLLDGPRLSWTEQNQSDR